MTAVSWVVLTVNSKPKATQVDIGGSRKADNALDGVRVRTGATKIEVFSLPKQRQMSPSCRSLAGDAVLIWKNAAIVAEQVTQQLFGSI
jgi:hypothetical protein